MVIGLFSTFVKFWTPVWNYLSSQFLMHVTEETTHKTTNSKDVIRCIFDTSQIYFSNCFFQFNESNTCSFACKMKLYGLPSNMWFRLLLFCHIRLNIFKLENNRAFCLTIILTSPPITHIVLRTRLCAFSVWHCRHMILMLILIFDSHWRHSLEQYRWVASKVVASVLEKKFNLCFLSSSIFVLSIFRSYTASQTAAEAGAVATTADHFHHRPR